MFKTAALGNVLVLDGVVQVTEKDECSYQEMMANIPLFAHPRYALHSPAGVGCSGRSSDRGARHMICVAVADPSVCLWWVEVMGASYVRC